MPDFAEAFDTLADTDYIVDVAKAGGGYMSGVLVQAAVEGRTSTDLPNPVYGAPGVIGGLSMGQMEVAMGAGAYSVVEGARMAGVEGSLAGLAGGSNR
jgi:hypothetical protein